MNPHMGKGARKSVPRFLLKIRALDKMVCSCSHSDISLRATGFMDRINSAVNTNDGNEPMPLPHSKQVEIQT